MKYPLGIQTFSEIREENYLYLDKTQLIYNLVSSGKVYFLSRPRRFGKSLLVSTLESLFLGHKSLFEGLAINDTDYDFAVYPVIKLEFSSADVDQAADFKQYIVNVTNDFANRYDIKLEIDSYEQRFAELVRKLYLKTQQKVVVLIDEYDKSILDNLNKPALPEIKEVMNAFYGVIKTLDEYLKFIFITGVTKFAKVSVFSGMNNLTDLSLHRRYANLCGITQQEFENNFNQGIEELAELEQLTKDDLLTKIKHWYNGYLFHPKAVGVYNPYSLLSLFEYQEFQNYWFTTATPTFLLNLLQETQYDLKNLSQFEIGASAFAASEPEDMSILSLFVQTGYLTIKDYKAPLYTLDFPNFEVKSSFYDSVATRFAHLDSGLSESYTHKLVEYIKTGDLDNFFATLSRFFANIPYDIAIKDEKYYQSLFYAVFTLLGLTIEAEVRTNIGRIDCVLQTDDTIYVIEFKLNDTCEAAMQQIHDKQYAQKYQDGRKEIVLVGVEFDHKTRNIGRFVREIG
ncbi:MAG: ATP-binding protein [Algicola sp.]|nr:ATP-binding protein [Algicola sp.]